VEYAKNIQQIGQLRFVDLYGREVHSMSLSAFSNITSLNVDSFSPGIYFIEIQRDANAVERVKIVITH